MSLRLLSRRKVNALLAEYNALPRHTSGRVRGGAKELCEKYGVHGSTISKILAGETYVNKKQRHGPCQKKPSRPTTEA